MTSPSPTAIAKPATSIRFSVLAGCLFASGAAGLIYEVVWVRLFSEVMGHTVYALSAVLTAFLGGLALGAYLAGKWTATRGATLRLYAVIELGIACFAVAMPSLIDACSPLIGAAYRSLGDSFVAYNLVQAAVCGGLVLIPTALMGATLPVVAALLLKEENDITVGAGWVYGLNTFGAAVGAAAAGFFLLPRLGMSSTCLLAACLNVMVAVLAYSFGTRKAGQTPSADTTAKRAQDRAARVARRRADKRVGTAIEVSSSRDWPAPSYRMLLWLYGLSGFASLTLEVGWARVASLSIGSTTYGFSVILVTFITGLALGGLLAVRVGFMLRRPVMTIFALNVAIALWSVISLPYLGSMPIHVIQLMGKLGLEFGDLLVGELLLVWSTILVPTLCMGAMFPLVAQLVYRSVKESGRAIGAGYAANTWGNILGSFAAGFILIPTIGMRATIVFSAAISMTVAAAYLLPALGEHRKATLTRLAVLAAMIGAGILWAPRWDREIITSGPYFYGDEVLEAVQDNPRSEHIERVIHAAFDELVDYREGPTTVASVRRKGKQLYLQAGGYIEAGSYAPTQQLIAHLPLLLHGDAKRVLVVGLGTGITLGSVLKHPVESADCVEISAEVADMAAKYFSDETDDALGDPRANLIIGDGRNHLRHCGKSYDVIVSQPSVPWMSGAASLFTYECFMDMRARLAEGGIACAWYQPWDTEIKDMRSLLRTWTEVFPHSYVFESHAVGEYLLIGMRDARPISAAAITDALSPPPVKADLKRLNILDTADLLGGLFFSGEAVRSHVQDDVVNTDDNAFIEFTTPTGIFTREKLSQHERLHRLREHPSQHIEFNLATDQENEKLTARLDAIYRSKDLILQARLLISRAKTATERRQIQPRWREIMERAAKLNPRDPYVIENRRALQKK